ncbi:PRP38 family-domain-containing protein [Naematelia encephala]|uniref:Pre-mRNA-splicing factor 38 n=1 Tax=Naematelia encephala TaxID=71784 RepID=A0A1Y2B1N6_9TREE|nr:PRP38 family-domain-containing protein [Naematelia encephala]
MANSTVHGAQSIHGSNPQFLIEKVIRARIYDTLYWKEQCFALTAESIIDKAIELNAIGGVHDRQIPTHFMCLTLKLLQLQPEKEILIEYLLAEEFKYLRALAAFYVRLTFRAMDVYEILEPLMRDFRKLRIRQPGGYAITYFDEFIDELLTKERVCDIILPRLTQRSVLEETEGLPPRKSLLDEDAEEEEARSKRQRLSSRTPSRTPPSSRESSPDLRRRDRSRSASNSESESDRGRYISRSPSPSRSGSEDAQALGEIGDTRGRYVSRSPSISPDRVLEVAGEGDDRIDGDV